MTPRRRPPRHVRRRQPRPVAELPNVPAPLPEQGDLGPLADDPMPDGHYDRIAEIAGEATSRAELYQVPTAAEAARKRRMH